MSANTLVTQRLRLTGRKAIAMLAGALVLATGVATTVSAAHDLGPFALVPGLRGVDLVAAPAGAPTLAEHSSVEGAAQLDDPTLSHGLMPGQAAYFGYRLGLTAASLPSADVTMDPTAVEGSQDGLSYEVRQVGDATQCRAEWASGQVVVPPRPFSAGASAPFAVQRMADSVVGAQATQLCIKVSLDPAASAPQTGSVTWRFVATATAEQPGR